MNKTPALRRTDLVYPELSYQIIEILFEVFKQIGAGYREKYCHKMIALELTRYGLNCKREVPAIIQYKGVKIGKCFFDFLIEDKIILEIKKDNNFSRKHIEQVHSYLKTAGLKLGIIANFTKEGIKYKRILNEK